MKKHRFGIFVDSYNVKLWQYNTIKSLLDNGDELCLVVINQEKKKYRVRLNNVFFFIYKKIFIRSAAQSGKSIRDLLGESRILFCKVNRKGKYSEYFRIEDIDSIKSHKLDFLLRFGFGIIRGEVLNAAKYGIWSFHHGDEQKYRGGPYCFWEIFNGEPVTCAILQKLTNKLDAGVVLQKGYFKTISHSFTKNIDQALALSFEWPSKISLQLKDGTFQIPNFGVQTYSKIHFAPSNLTMAVFVAKLLKNKIKHFYTTYLTFDSWHVGIISKPIDEVINKPIHNADVKWLKAEVSYFYADPFIFEKDNQMLLAVEYLPYKGFKGQIKVFSGEKFENEEPDYVIKEDYHLSYPNGIKDKTAFYIMPEAYQGNNLYLYEKKATGWKKHVIIENIKCIDPEIIFHNGYYYLFTTIKNDYHDTKLFIYYSKDLLNGWEPHLLNPVVTDVRAARGAGKIFLGEQGILYRPGQNYSIHKEGSITICQINKLSPREYSEEVVSHVAPVKNSKYGDKIHTINAHNNITVIDACEMRSFLFRPDILIEIVKSKL